MCLDKIINEKPLKEGIGYKVVIVGQANYRTNCEGTLLTKTEWNEAYTSIFLPTRSDQLYKSGFHIWKTLVGAKMWLNKCAEICKETKQTILKVSYKDATVEGVQHGSKCIVVNQLKVIEEVKL
jgi:hypothetical protein